VWQSVRTGSHRIRNYADNDGETGKGGNFRLALPASLHIHTAQFITQEHKLHDSSKVPSDRFNVQFHLQRGSPTCGHKPAGGPSLYNFPHATREPAAHNNECRPLL